MQMNLKEGNVIALMIGLAVGLARDAAHHRQHLAPGVPKPQRPGNRQPVRQAL